MTADREEFSKAFSEAYKGLAEKDVYMAFEEFAYDSMTAMRGVLSSFRLELNNIYKQLPIGRMEYDESNRH